MAKAKTIYACTECGASASKWQGQCPGCGVWNTLVETVEETSASSGKRFAALIPEDAYGRVVEAAFRDAVAKSGASVAEIKTYPMNAIGMIERLWPFLEEATQVHQRAPFDWMR